MTILRQRRVERRRPVLVFFVLVRSYIRFRVPSRYSYVELPCRLSRSIACHLSEAHYTVLDLL